MQSGSKLARLFALGARFEGSTPVRERIILSNQIAAIVVVIAMLAIATSPSNQERSLPLGFGFLAMVALGVPCLNALGLTSASRLLLVVCPPVILVGAGALAGAHRPGYVMALPYALLTMSLLPLLLFHPPAEKVPWRIGVALIGVALFGHDWLVAGALGDDGRRLLEETRRDTKLAQMILWALIIASVQFARDADPGPSPGKENRPVPVSGR